MKSNKSNWRKYTLEFLSIFIAVTSAFALNNWNDNRRAKNAESKILTEILNGLEKDKADVDINLEGHKQGLQACKFWRNVVAGQSPNTDTLIPYYLALARDFTSIQNTSGYETLKSRGFELIKNDALREKIISLYEYDYQTLRKIEEEYYELQFQENYFSAINTALAPSFIFDDKGRITGIELPVELSKSERNILLSYLWKIRVNREFAMRFYNAVEIKINSLQEEIKVELAN